MDTKQLVGKKFRRYSHGTFSNWIDRIVKVEIQYSMAQNRYNDKNKDVRTENCLIPEIVVYGETHTHKLGEIVLVQ